jgi:hypothetical protein
LNKYFWGISVGIRTAAKPLRKETKDLNPAEVALLQDIQSSRAYTLISILIKPSIGAMLSSYYDRYNLITRKNMKSIKKNLTPFV